MGLPILSQLWDIWLNADDQKNIADWNNTINVETELVAFRISLAAILVPEESEKNGFGSNPTPQFEERPTIVIERIDPQNPGDGHRYNMFAIWNVKDEEIYVAQPAFIVEQVEEERGSGFTPLVHNVKVGLREGYTNFVSAQPWTQAGNEFQSLRYSLWQVIKNGFGTKKVEKNL